MVLWNMVVIFFGNGSFTESRRTGGVVGFLLRREHMLCNVEDKVYHGGDADGDGNLEI